MRIYFSGMSLCLHDQAFTKKTRASYVPQFDFGSFFDKKVGFQIADFHDLILKWSRKTGLINIT